MSSSWHSYPQILAIGHRYLEGLLLDPVLIEEKVDGSQFSAGVFDGELRCKSKGAIINSACPEKMFSKAVDTVKSLPLREGWTYRFEFLGKPKHNALAYDRAPKGNIILFDINTDEEAYMPYEEKKIEVERLGLEVVPILYYGMVTSPEMFLKFLETPSILGGGKIEGMVIKNYKRFGIDKKALMGKYVSEAFKEVHASEWKKANPSREDIIQEIIHQYRTPARWSKAAQHLREAGKLDESPKDIGFLIKEAQLDIEKECADEIKEILWGYTKPQIMRGSTAGLPEWWKGELVKLQFNREEAH